MELEGLLLKVQKVLEAISERDPRSRKILGATGRPIRPTGGRRLLPGGGRTREANPRKWVTTPGHDDAHSEPADHADMAADYLDRTWQNLHGAHHGMLRLQSLEKMKAAGKPLPNHEKLEKNAKKFMETSHGLALGMHKHVKVKKPSGEKESEPRHMLGHAHHMLRHIEAMTPEQKHRFFKDHGDKITDMEKKHRMIKRLRARTQPPKDDTKRSDPEIPETEMDPIEKLKSYRKLFKI